MVSENRIGVIFEDVSPFFSEEDAVLLGERILTVLSLQGRELSLLFCTPERIRELNRDYRSIDRETDVLSFSMSEGETAGFDHSILGDVVICIDVLLRQAVEQGVAPREELARLLIHGILHLAGYDHEHGGTEADSMRAEEERLLSELEDWFAG